MRFALAHIADSRDDYYAQRAALAKRQIDSLDWLRERGCVAESDVMRDPAAIDAFAETVKKSGADALIIHLGIWADPSFAVQLAELTALPVLLLGNRLPNSSSVVGTLGAGGALDAIGLEHVRVFYRDEGDRAEVLAFLRAAETVAALRGRKLLRFGGCSLGILTAEPNEQEFREKYGVSVEQLDQMEIVERANALDAAEVERHKQWIRAHAQVRTGEDFPEAAFDMQVRSYLAIRALAWENGAAFVGVKCQRELSDGYVCQCLPHLLLAGTADADGEKMPMIFACESDANGALSMEVLHLLSGGCPAALLDVRTLDTASGRLIAANCGAVPEDMLRTEPDRPLSGVELIPHTFGLGRGGAAKAHLREGKVTVARFCERNGQIWLAAGRAELVALTPEEDAMIPPSFPGCAMQTAFDESFLREFGSNHLHIVYGDYLEELRQFCRMTGTPCRVWERAGTEQ